jgi:hypothetical protein
MLLVYRLTDNLRLCMKKLKVNQNVCYDLGSQLKQSAYNY